MQLLDRIGEKIISSLITVTTIITGTTTASGAKDISPSATPSKPAVQQQLKIHETPIPLNQKAPIVKIEPKATSTKSTASKSSAKSQPKTVSKKPTVSTQKPTAVKTPAITPVQTKTAQVTPSTKPQTTTEIVLDENASSTVQITSTNSLGASTTLRISPTATIYKPETTVKVDLPTESNELSARIQKSLVNIFCKTRDAQNERVLTGSGVIIDPRGIVLTNAHVAEYPLLQDDFKDINLKCIARLGSPTSATYDLDVLYISPRWVEENYDNLALEAPKESGQYDFALLKLRTAANQSPAFSYLPVASGIDLPTVGQKIILASYPALILEKQGINTLLRSNIHNTTIRDYYSFTGKYIDLLQTQVTPLAEPGSSGGALTDEHGNVLGIITTILSSGQLDQKYIQAITVRHINDTLLTYKWGTLQDMLNLNTTTLKEDFDTSLRDRLRNLLLTGMRNPRS